MPADVLDAVTPMHEANVVRVGDRIAETVFEVLGVELPGREPAFRIVDRDVPA